MPLELHLRGQEGFSLGVLFTLDRKSVVHMMLDVREELLPECTAFLRFRECVRITDHYEAIPCAREQHIETFGRHHETDVVVNVASRQRGYHDVALLALVVICRHLILR